MKRKLLLNFQPTRKSEVCMISSKLESMSICGTESTAVTTNKVVTELLPESTIKFQPTNFQLFVKPPELTDE
jgi:hypothetical protein